MAVAAFSHVAIRVSDLDRSHARIRLFDTRIVLEPAAAPSTPPGIRRLSFVGPTSMTIEDPDGPELDVRARAASAS